MPRTHPRRPKSDVSMDSFREVRDELVRRIGQTEAARRMGVSTETIAEHRLRQKAAVSRQTYDAALSVLEKAREDGEDGWSTLEARLRNLNPVLAGYASGVARRNGSVLSAFLERHPTIPRDVADKLREVVKPDWTVEQIDNEADRQCLLWEHGTDLAQSVESWARPDEEGRLLPFADFECSHGRLSGDKTPPCGCWPGEQI